MKKEYKELEFEVLKSLGYLNWDIVSSYDNAVIVRNQHAFQQYNAAEYIKENQNNLAETERIIKRKNGISENLNSFLNNNSYKTNSQYHLIEKQIRAVLDQSSAYIIRVKHISADGIQLAEKTVKLYQGDIDKFYLEKEYKKLESEVLKLLGFLSWNISPYYDAHVVVKSRQALENYDDIKFFRENTNSFAEAERILNKKKEISNKLNIFLKNNNYKTAPQYHLIEKHIRDALGLVSAYRIHVKYISSAGNHLGDRTIAVTQHSINKFYQDPSLLMSKGEYAKQLKEQRKKNLEQKHREYYDRVNNVIDYANENKDSLVIRDSKEQLDKLIAQLFDRTVNSIKKIKTIDSEEWDIIGNFITRLMSEIRMIVSRNQMILDYYDSPHFLKVKNTCEVLMSTQREFNEYITEKVESISKLFGTKVVRNETVNDDEYNYIRPYKKTITPFTAEVSAAVFASAENNPLEYIVKNFYPNKTMYPEQIQKLYLLVEELETLKEAKQIIENYKKEYQQYLEDVPSFVLENDEAGFYSRLGFANIDESIFAVEYKFSYTSGGGMAQRSFTVPMTEDIIIQLINVLKSKLTASAFAKEQRSLMTKKLRELIKSRDNFTCCYCGNSTFAEPNLLLEIDHIIPVAKGGCTVAENLQTLCWKCNRSKSDKIIL